jgi:YgiT-type zinc finger domain-containing protein
MRNTTARKRTKSSGGFLKHEDAKGTKDMKGLGSAMRCVICRHGEARSGKITVTLERDELTLVIKDVPAQVCDNCGEEYLDDATAENLLKIAGEEAKAGAELDVQQYRIAL